MKYGLSDFFWEMLRENKGEQWSLSKSWSGHQEWGETIKTDTSITINSTTFNKVLITKQWDRGWFGITPDDHWRVREYYAKNVGLIKRESRIHYPFDTTFVIEYTLLNYHINK